MIKSKIYAVIDCDGVITDGTSIYDGEKKFAKTYGSYDKEMTNFLSQSLGWEFMFVSDDKAGLDITRTRVEHLMKKNDRIHFANMNWKERLDHLKDMKLKVDFTVFVGDSLSDIPSMSVADYAGCPNNSPDMVNPYCNYRSYLDGGHGGLADILWNIHLMLKDHLK